MTKPIKTPNTPPQRVVKMDISSCWHCPHRQRYGKGCMCAAFQEPIYITKTDERYIDEHWFPRWCPLPSTPEPNYAGLSPTQLDIARRRVAGETVKAIAIELRISKKSVENRMEKIYRKLNVHSVAGLVNFARDNHWEPFQAKP